ncbi:MAG: protein-glutamate O-methyltransferase CheR [Acidobacteria bacterium]|nr:protein-glutamate O-methyltransferase CheR [Acidobacteriota bacterium]
MRPENFIFLRSLMRQHAGVLLEEGKEYLVLARLGPLARRESWGSVDELISHLRSRPNGELRRQVAEAMVTTETSFFRDVHPFQTLKDVIFPDLIERRAGSRTLRIWSAACAAGQEAYSVAMLLKEHFGDLPGWHVRIVASDVSSAMIERAKLGSYSQLEINRGVPSHLLTRHFERDGLQWRVNEDIRQMVDFRQINLATPFPPLPEMDIIFARNVLIYFDENTRREVLRRLAGNLRKDGYLFVGGAETMIAYSDLFYRLQIDRTSCYRPRR